MLIRIKVSGKGQGVAGTIPGEEIKIGKEPGLILLFFNFGGGGLILKGKAHLL